EPLLTERESAVVRRGKNSTKATVAKHATPQEYRASTALEALFGWLYLQNENARIEALFDVIWDSLYLNTP
ncbi:MAG: cysteine--tRNA ligase, partial [Ruthenibacterium sp.]